MMPVYLYNNGIDIKIDIPDWWNELDTEEVTHLCKLQLSNLSVSYIKISQFLFSVAHRAKLQKVKLPSHWQQKINTEDLVCNGMDCMNFLYENNDLTINHIPFVVIRKWFRTYKFIGPVNAFETITCGEFEEAEQFIIAFQQEPLPSHLSNVAAILWRPNNTPFYSQHGEMYNYKKAVPLMQQLQPWQLYLMFIWYIGCRLQLPVLFPNLYDGSNKEETDGMPIDLLSFTKCIHAGAGVKNGNRTEIRRMKLLEFLFDMEQEAIAHNKTLEMYEQQRNAH